jgi:hypothetical protein
MDEKEWKKYRLVVRLIALIGLPITFGFATSSLEWGLFFLLGEIFMLAFFGDYHG